MTEASERPAPALIEALFRAEGGRARAAVAAMTGSLDVAEDAVQEAFADALRSWPRDGVPHRPGAWITTAAKNRALDRLRREAQRPERERLADPRTTIGGDVATVSGQAPVDEELQLLFTCCHPALSLSARVALTLRFVFGLTAKEIARLFLDTETTTAQRLTRAKAKIRTARIPLRVPPPELFGERVPSVLSCIYLAFTEGYAPADGDDAIRNDLCRESVRLARLVHQLVPSDGEAQSLLALLLLQDSRRAARRAPSGVLVALEDQNRDLWDKARAAEGLAHLRAAADHERGSYFLQAVIAGAHAVAPSFEETDWATIVGTYDQLLALQDTPIVRLNRAIAVSFRDGPAEGLRELEAVSADRRLARAPTLAAARADLLRRMGRSGEAADEYEAAIRRTANGAVRTFLQMRLDEMQGSVTR